MRAAILALPLLAIGAPAAAQSMDHMNMPGMSMPGMKAKPSAKPKTPAKVAPEKRPVSPRPSAQRKPAPTTSGQDHDMATMPDMRARGPAADRHGGHDVSTMPGMDMGQQPAADPHAGHDISAMPGMTGADGDRPAQPMQGHGMSAMGGMTMEPPGVVKPVVGNAPAPPPPADNAADRIWGADAMRGSRDDMRRDQGAQNFYMVLFNLAEYQARRGRDGYRWDGEAWYGGDINRLVAKTEGEGAFREGVGSAEVQALYSRTIGPYWNVQAGVRHDFKPNPSRTYATVGIKGLAPNNFEAGGALFLSDKADLLARLEGYYDQRLTQRLILQPRAEFNLSAQDMRAEGYGAGLVDAELGLRLRYEVKRELAPYVGVSWERQFGDTARFSRARGQDTGGFSFVAGVRTWF